jgi:hypothetical protein
LEPGEEKPASLGGLAAIAAKLSTDGAPYDMFEGPDRVTSRPSPPVHLWNPAHCGDIGMEIRADGSWWHAGAPIRRQELVNLFASILRLEGDGAYYLVTPVEKVVVAVAMHPLRVVDAEPLADRSPETLILTLNTGGQIPLDSRHTLAFESKAAGAAYVTLDNGLTALFTRAAWYRLAERVDADGVVSSSGIAFKLA